MNPSTNHECGMLVGGFGRHPMIMTTWNPRYYPTLVEGAGFGKAKDLLAYFFPMQGERAFEMPERVKSLAERALAGKQLTFRDLDLKNFKAEVDRCWEIYNDAWEPNWGFVPMSKESFFHEAQVLKYIVFPQFTFMAEVNGEPAEVVSAILPQGAVGVYEVRVVLPDGFGSSSSAQLVLVQNGNTSNTVTFPLE